MRKWHCSVFRVNIAHAGLNRPFLGRPSFGSYACGHASQISDARPEKHTDVHMGAGANERENLKLKVRDQTHVGLMIRDVVIKRRDLIPQPQVSADHNGGHGPSPLRLNTACQALAEHKVARSCSHLRKTRAVSRIRES